ncbi:MAG: bifunctional phosphoglucose/phosphomannose isomerase [Crocinitomicaceae bacterium]|nr:bifunctional phosphoglucose/phosphomannose isomerase [Crocinitomicaceae bacterium]
MMEELISAFPANITEALAIAKASTFKKPSNEIHNIVICGMGGSGIGGKMVAKWVEDELNVPVYCAQDYTLPAFVSENSLVIGSSYSGNTEETIASVEAAIAANAHIIGVCSGGKLAQICKDNGYDSVIVPGGNPPRTALAFSLVQLLNIFKHLGLIAGKELDEMEAARKLIVENEAAIKEEAMAMAKFLQGNVGILYGTTKYEPVLIRARQQFNENSKLLCWHHMIPEMNHNELVGWGGGDDRFATIMFVSDDINKRNAKRIQISRDVVKSKSSKYMEVKAKGDTTLMRSIYLINIVDWSSLYLSDLKKVDPIDIEVIDFLKNELSNFN